MQAEFRLPCPTFRKIPQRHIRKIATIISATAEAIASADCPAAYGRAWKFFFLLPRLLLQAPTRDRGGRRITDAALAARAELVGNRLLAEPSGRFYEYRASLSDARPDVRRSNRLATDPDESYLPNEIMRQLHDGHISRAAALLSSPGLAPTVPATADRLQVLWSRPAREAPAAWSPPEPVLAAEISEAVRDHLYRSLQSATRGSGAGLSGWRFEFLFPLLRAPTTEWGPFSRLMCSLASGAAPAWVFDVLSTGRATALRKGGECSTFSMS